MQNQHLLITMTHARESEEHPLIVTRTITMQDLLDNHTTALQDVVMERVNEMLKELDNTALLIPEEEDEPLF